MTRIVHFINVNKCGREAVCSNITINSFVESKRLNFSEKKCNRMHIGKKCSGQCIDIKVHENNMNQSSSEKYVGDIICDDGSNDKNIAARRAKGFGIAGDILAILDEVPLGAKRIEAGLIMRNGMLINGILTNSEVWLGMNEQQYRQLEQVDEYLLRGILKAHCKGPIESLYLETGIIPIRYIIKKRRIMYLRHLLTRDKNELISKVYFAQLRKSVKNDWVNLVKNDIKEEENTKPILSYASSKANNEKQIKFHDRIKFSKNGSTATTAAVKLARAKTGRDLIAVPHDHPFYSYDDWFIGKTQCNKGVPNEISELSLTFKSCSLRDLEKLFRQYPNQIAGVIMEPERVTCSNCNCSIPVSDYLQKAIKLTQRNGAVSYTHLTLPTILLV